MSTVDNDNPRRAASRARTKIRRYIVANNLTTAVTLTFAEVPIRPEAAVPNFIRRLRRALPSCPYVWVWELGENGRLHLHGAFPAAALPMVGELWDHGHAYVDELAADEIRAWAQYIAKDFERGPVIGSHLAHVSRGFRPEQHTIEIPASLVQEELTYLTAAGEEARIRASETAFGCQTFFLPIN